LGDKLCLSSFLEFSGKNGLLAGFSKSLFHRKQSLRTMRFSV
jgi:hypothetical protein